MLTSLGVLLLVSLVDPEDEIRALVQALGADRIEVRDGAEQRLRELGRRAVPALREASKRGNLEVAVRAERTLRVLEIADQLTPAFRKAWPAAEWMLASGNDGVWTEVFLKMAKHDPPLAGKDLDPLVVRAFRGAYFQDDRLTVFNAASKRGCLAAIPELVRVVKDSGLSYRVIRAGAAESLYELGGQEQVPQFISWLKDSDCCVRAPGVRAMAKFKVLSEVGELRRILKEDNNSYVRGVAMYTLIKLVGREAIPDIAPLVADPEREISEQAMKVLARLKAVEAVEEICKYVNAPLIRNMRTIGEDSRFDVLDLLSDLDDPRAAPSIWPLLRDKEPAMRRVAAYILRSRASQSES